MIETTDLKSGMVMKEIHSSETGQPSASNNFAIVHTWPDLKNAEYEVLQRLLGAAANIGARAVVVDRNGIVIWAHTDLDVIAGEVLPPNSVAFVLAMHFESGRVLDFYSYFTLWQPIGFYHDFGYQTSIDKVTSYNDLISCDSEIADAHGLNLLTALGRLPLMPLPRMFHMLPEPFLVPKTNEESRLFYIGINWERVGRPRGRFHECLLLLDKLSLLDIYGPEVIMGVATWAGFKSYRGELPFDGVSVKNAINRSGICLVLSSAAHKAAGIMSNRLFEGLAGGAAIIATPHPLIDKYFSDVAYIVDDTRGEELLGQQIVAAVQCIRADPVEAKRRTLRGQSILRERFLLEASLKDLIAQTPARRKHFESQFLADTRVSVILTYHGDDIREVLNHIEQFACQKRSTIVLHVVCGERFGRRHGRDLEAAAVGSLESVICHPAGLDLSVATFDGPLPTRSRTGPAIARILQDIDTPCFAFFGIEDQVFSDHFASIAKSFSDQPEALMACSGMISQIETLDGRMKRNFEEARFVDYSSIVLVNGTGQRGRFAYKAELISGAIENLMTMLDGEEQSYFRLAGFLAGPLAQTNYASYVMRRTALVTHRPVEPLEHQQQYIRDAFARDPRWLKALSAGDKLPEFVYAYSPGTPIRWQDYHPPRSVAQNLIPDTEILTRAGSDGLRFLVGGFSQPEADHVWLEGERGVIEFSLQPSEPARYEDHVLVLTVAGRRCLETGRNQHVTVAINGMVTHYATVPERFVDLEIAIPRMLMRGASTFRVEITPDHAEPVFDDRGAVIDPRRLSVDFNSIAVRRTLQAEPPVFVPGVSYSCGKRQVGSEALLSHFHEPEEFFAWIAGQKGIIWFRLQEIPSRPELRLRLRARRSLQTGLEPVLAVSINGSDLGSHALFDGEGDLTVDMSKADLSRKSVYIVLTVSHAEAVFDLAHNVVDPRLLGVAVSAIGVFERPTSSELSALVGPPEEAAPDGKPDRERIGWRQA
jgi:hypothetical protein